VNFTVWREQALAARLDGGEVEGVAEKLVAQHAHDVAVDPYLVAMATGR
jgi:hypothetical protein